jgi:hypothetical protein
MTEAELDAIEAHYAKYTPHVAKDHVTALVAEVRTLRSDRDALIRKVQRTESRILALALSENGVE